MTAPDTSRWDYEDPCSDCGEVGDVYLKHTGPLVPAGTTGFFDQKCWEERKKHYNSTHEAKPLGEKWPFPQSV